MFSLSIYLAFLGFWFCYQTSGKAILNAPNRIEVLARRNTGKARALGSLLLVSGMLVSIGVLGFGSGIFAYLLILTSVTSVVIILAPLGLLNLANANGLAVIFLLTELFFYAGKS